MSDKQKHNPEQSQLETQYTPEQQQEIKKFESILERKQTYKKYPNLKWSYLGDNFFAISSKGNGEIDLFYKDSSPYFNVINVRKDMGKIGVYEQIFKQAGYKEELRNGIHVMIDIKTNKEIDPYSKEYLEAWNQIMFYETYRFINYSSLEELKKSKYDTLGYLNIGKIFVNSLRIKHVISVLKKIGGKNEKVLLLYLKDFTPEIIKGWITDERFKAFNDIPTREEYKEYLDKGYIEKKLYEECMEIFELRDKKEKQEKQIKQTVNTKIKKINN